MLRAISGNITGMIASMNVPQVKAGDSLNLTISYNANNPTGGPLFGQIWKIYIVAVDSLGNRKIVKDADVKAKEFSDSGNWYLWKMPSERVTLEVRLYGCDEVKPWDWAWW